MKLKVIAHIRSAFPTKFGIPHQSNRIPSLKSMIIFEKEYRCPDAFRGLEEYDYIWLLWGFSANNRDSWSPTVRPPRLGGNERKGVFATRSPFRPNPIGLSSVKLERLEMHPEHGPVLYISGADLMDGTPIYDIKPYLPYVDSHAEASGGFTDRIDKEKLQVICPEEYMEEIPKEHREALYEILADDPRPGYQNDPERMYGMAYLDKDIHFRVDGNVLTVYEITKYKK